MDDFIDADKDDRTFQHLVRIGIQDGGQWDMFVSLIKKYGVVPKESMDETANSSYIFYLIVSQIEILIMHGISAAFY